jgi:hypothetical protein
VPWRVPECVRLWFVMLVRRLWVREHMEMNVEMNAVIGLSLHSPLL